MAQTKRKSAPARKRAPAAKKGTTRSKRKATSRRMTQKERARRNQTWAFVLFVLALFTFLALFQVQAAVIEFFGSLGRKTIGVGFFFVPFSLVFGGVLLIASRGRPIRGRVACALLLPVCIGASAHALVGDAAFSFSKAGFATMANAGNALQGGGVLAGYFAAICVTYLSRVATVILFLLGTFLLLLDACNITLISIWDHLKELWDNRRQGVEYDEYYEEEDVIPQPVKLPKRRRPVIDVPLDGEVKEMPHTEPIPVIVDGAETASLHLRPPAVKSPAEVLIEQTNTVDPTVWKQPEPEPEPEPIEPMEIPDPTTGEEPEAYAYPPLSLLKPAKSADRPDTSELSANAQRLIDTIKSFGIEAHVVNVVSGPAVTRYEIQLDPGVKVSRLTGLADDIALSLGASGVFIAPIPDKLAIGIEVPNKTVQVVSLQEVVASDAFETAKSTVAFAMGRDITGNCIVSDIAKLPHLLIAGTTGSGKSVCMNSLIVSMLYKSTPDEVRLIMIDPKMVELGVYNGIPHLLVPVVTDPRKAAGALQWAVIEMMKRYKLFADNGVRDMKGYNSHIERTGEGEKIPRIVVVIDELADLMVVARKEVEDSIMRLTQMARAAGMHLVIATQRPSVDVITGVIKSNIPSRIAFAVASKIESNIILGSMGAEKLIGRGDMLYAPIGSTKPTRIQGCFISDDEVEAVVAYIKKGKETTYSEEVIAQIEQQAEKSEPGNPAVAGTSTETDEMLDAAIDVVMESGQASVSMLQRRLKLGYSRAARIVDQMEESGIVGGFEGAKPRQILISKEQWQEIKMRRESAL